MSKENVKSLCAEAAKAKDSGDAMRFSQAANNVANAMCALNAVTDTKKIQTTAELVQDKSDPNIYRVESIDDDGSVEVAIFSGPNALERAIHFAGASNYYDTWGDPQGLAGV